MSPNWRLTCTFSKSTSTVGSEQKQGSSGQNDRTETPPSTGIVQHLSSTDIDLTEFLNPSGLYDYLKRNHPSIVSFIFVRCTLIPLHMYDKLVSVFCR